MKSKVLSTIMAMTLGAGLVASAVAAPPHLHKDFEIKVSYADLNIDREAGAQVLYQRLRNASAKVCGYTRMSTGRSLSDRAATKLCFNKTLNRAVEQVGSAKLSEIHDG